jgi:hypothetical protein
VLFGAGVTHRLDVRKNDRSTSFDFQGLLDAAAFEELRVRVRAAVKGGAAVRVVLREKTDVERACVEGLRALEVEVVAESAYLARWIRGDAP